MAFLKTTGIFDRFEPDPLLSRRPCSLSSQEKVLLNRKGNEFFRAGQIENAKRIFVTTSYSDGLIRVGDYYLSKQMPVEALKMYWLAHDQRRSEELIVRASQVISNLLREEVQNGPQ